MYDKDKAPRLLTPFHFAIYINNNPKATPIYVHTYPLKKPLHNIIQTQVVISLIFSKLNSSGTYIVISI